MLPLVAIGIPRPQGSHKHVGRGVIVDSSKYLRPWRETMRDSFEQQLPPGHVEFDEPLDVMLVFRLPQPKTVDREWPTTPPDLDKLIRACFDSCSDAGVWKDDSRVVKVTAQKEYTEFSPGVWVYIRTLTEYPIGKLGKETTPDATHENIPSN